jgi:hypothetical protein
VSPLNAVVEGMAVRVARDEPDQAGLADAPAPRDAGGRGLARARP